MQPVVLIVPNQRSAMSFGMLTKHVNCDLDAQKQGPLKETWFSHFTNEKCLQLPEVLHQIAWKRPDFFQITNERCLQLPEVMHQIIWREVIGMHHIPLKDWAIARWADMVIQFFDAIEHTFVFSEFAKQPTPFWEGSAVRVTENGKFWAAIEDMKWPFQNDYTAQSKRVIDFAAAERSLLYTEDVVVFSSGIQLAKNLYFNGILVKTCDHSSHQQRWRRTKIGHEHQWYLQ